MKRYFGAWTMRLIRGGCTLNDGEHHLLCVLVSELPSHLREKVEVQFDSYNLVQREADSRALNFYRARFGFRGLLPVTPVLRCKIAVAPLVKVSMTVAGVSDLLHATLTAVDGRAFCVSFSRAVSANSKSTDYSIEKVTKAWLSNFD